MKILKSIKTKLFLLLVCTILSVIVFTTVLNSLVLEPYYINLKKKSLVELYNKVNKVFQQSNIDYELELERLDNLYSATITIYDVANMVTYSTVPFWNPYYYTEEDFSPQGPQNPHEPEKNKRVRIQNNNPSPSVIRNKRRQLKGENISYIISLNDDKRLNGKFLSITALLQKEMILYAQIPIESIKESAEVTNRFILLTGLFITIISSFAVVFIAKRFADPIIHLSDIASAMAKFDFSKKYTDNDDSEIGVLGSSINKLSEKLESTISELKSANAKLLSDIEEKTKLDEMRKNFISNVSHELKTPIALISGYAEGLKENVITDEAAKNEYCDIILDEAAKMDVLVQKLLTLSQIESGKDTPVIRRFDITSLIKSTILKNSLLLSQKDIEVKFSEKEPVYVWADEFMIEQVISNYLQNAINHVDGKKDIRITIEKKEKTVKIGVYNSGKQIPENVIQSIWDSFYKSDKSRSREYGGHGLGLSVVAAIMKSHKMPYGVENQTDGVLFYIELENDKNL